MGPEVLIVGAGPSGLTCAHELQRRGVSALILERGATPGTTFHRFRESMSLVSPRFFSELPGLPFPPGSPPYLPMRAFARYLEEYARHHALSVRTGVEVVRASASAGFELELAGGERLRAPHLVAASGVAGRPRLPDLDLSRVTIPWIHSADYADPGAFAGRETLIVGNGISAQEIALELAATRPVTMAGKRPFRVVPNPILGIDLHWFAFLPEMLPVKYAPWRPEEPLSGSAIRAALREGRVRPRPALVSLEGDRARFADGREERFDAVIFATGFLPDTAWLGELAGGGIVDNRSTAHPGLWFLGLPHARTFASRYIRGIRRDAAHVARAIARGK